MTVFGSGKKTKQKSHYLIIVQRACVNNRFPSLVLLIVSLVNILNSFDARRFYLGLKWSGKQITPNKLAFCYNTIWPHLKYPIGRAVFVTMNTMFLVTLDLLIFLNMLCDLMWLRLIWRLIFNLIIIF